MAEKRAEAAAREAQQLFFQIGMMERGRRAAELAELGLTFAQAHALRLLDPEKPLPMSRLAKELVCDASNVTGIADRLEARGLVERRSGERDRRVKELALTPAGVDLRRCVLELMTKPPAAIAALSPTDQRALRDILRRALEVAGTQEPVGPAAG
ncbi:MAG: MarR family transcriptional regulator, partial [Actinomycetota bacterium]|nr:MarR family transcriptional regulator [Actinomycetota bacterium]